MAKYLVEDTSLISIADAIRSKTGNQDKLSLVEMADTIAELRCGGDTESAAKLDAIIDRSITEIHSDIEEIGTYAFRGCSQLTTADFPVATYIGDHVFRDCSQLTTADFPAATYIGAYVFRDCSQLTTADFPAATYIGAYAFYGCSQLTTADFPVATYIGDHAFYGCSQLNALRLRFEKLCILASTNAFLNTPIESGTGYIYVPLSLVDSYKSATNWSKYAARFRALEDYTVDGTITGELDADKIGA